MSDQSGIQADKSQCTEIYCTPPSSPPRVQLQYPQILLEASFESLLTCSYASSRASTVKMSISHSNAPDLDESWASLDTTDFARDEDLQSEITDQGSLIDLQSTHESESIVDEEEYPHDTRHDCETSHGDATTEDEEERQEEEANINGLRHYFPHPVHEEGNDVLALGESSCQNHPPHVDLALVITSNILPRPDQSPQASIETGQVLNTHEALSESIQMTVSKHPIDNEGGPFNVAYFGTKSARAEQDVVMKKIGGVLISYTHNMGSSTSSDNSTFHLVPTHFDAAMKPTFAELVLSPAQMTVNEVVVTRSSIDVEPTHDIIDLILSDGTPVSPRRSDNRSGTRWCPDILIVHVDAMDLDDELATVNDVIAHAELHEIPLLTIAEGNTRDTILIPDEESLQAVCKLENKLHGTEAVYRVPVDVDFFLRVDSQQLNRHLRFLIDRSTQTRHSVPFAVPQTPPVWRDVLNFLPACLQRYFGTLRTGDDSSQVEKSGHIDPAEGSSANYTSLLDLCEHAPVWPLLWTSVIMLLGVFLVGIGLAIKEYSSPLKLIEANSPYSMSCNNDVSITPISSAFVKSATAKAVTTKALGNLVQQDIFPYLPAIPLLQSVRSTEVDTARTAADRDSAAQTDKTDILRSTSSKLRSKAKEVEQAIWDTLGIAQEKIPLETITQRKIQLYKQYLDGMDKIQVEIRSILDDVGTNTQHFYDRTCKQVRETVVRHSKLLTRPLEVTEGQLQQIVQEQKEVLTTAQKHAQQILQRARMPRNIFARRG